MGEEEDGWFGMGETRSRRKIEDKIIVRRQTIIAALEGERECR